MTNGEVSVNGSQGQVSDEEPPPGLYDCSPIQDGKRERKKIERLSIAGSNDKEKRFEIPEGRGTKLGDIPIIEHLIYKENSESLKPLHHLLFKTFGQLPQIKKHLRQFNGFGFDGTSDECVKKTEKLVKMTLAELKSFCSLLSLERGGTKEEIVKRIVDFLLKPEDSGKKVPQPKSKGKKRKSESKRKGGAEAKRSKKAKKAKKAENDSDAEDSKEDESGDDDDDEEGKSEASAASEEEEENKSEASAASEEEEVVKPKKKVERKKKAEKKKRPAAVNGNASSKKKKAPAKEEASSGSEEEEEEEDKSEASAASEEEEEEENKSEASAASEEEEEEKEVKPKKKVERKKKAETKKTPKRSPAAVNGNASSKKKKASAKAKAEKIVDDADISSDSDDSDDEPLASKKKSFPTDAELKSAVAGLLKDADLDSVTMKAVLKDVYAKFPGIDLSSKKDFLKKTVKNIIS